MSFPSISPVSKSRADTIPNLVLCCGMIRSASTLQYQLASAILASRGPLIRAGFVAPKDPLPTVASRERSICKLHHWEESTASRLKTGEAAGFYCFRDLRDVAVSAMQKFKIPFRQLWEEKWLQSSVIDGEHWLSMPNVYSAKYELLIGNLEREVQRMAEWLNISLAPSEAASIAADHSLQAQMERSAQRKTGACHAYDPDTLLHPDHVHEGKVGGWKSALTPEQSELIQDEFKEWLAVRGYEIPRILTPAISGEKSPSTSASSELFVPHCGWMSCPTRDEVAQLIREGHYEADLQAFLWLYLRPGSRMIDVGAHFGLYARLGSIAVGQSGKVLAIEPYPLTQEFITSNIRELDQCQLLKAALGAEVGVAALVTGQSGFAAHSYLTATSAESTVQVEVKTLDSVLATAGWPSVDFVKIDTEGREFDVVEGAGGLLGTPGLPVVSLEFSEKNLLSFGRTTRQLARYLEQHGYEICRFSFDSLVLVPVEENGWPVWYENYFAVLDRAAVNVILSSAPTDRRRIAGEIVLRAFATNRVKELAELETYRHQAKQSLDNKSWAESAENNLVQEKKKSVEFETWAKKTEKLLKQEKQRSADFETWALKTETELKKAKAQAVENQKWAEKTESELKRAKSLATENQEWAEKTEAELKKAKILATENQKWAEKTESELKRAKSLAIDNQKWAEKTETSLAVARKEATENRAWAERTEKLLADCRARVADRERG